jgi:hypothetical protein
MVGGGRRAAWISGLYSPQPHCVLCAVRSNCTAAAAALLAVMAAAGGDE